MPGLLPDVNIERHFLIIAAICSSEPWREVWTGLGITIYSFAAIRLSREMSDLDLWKLCQEREIVLLTANRNDDGPDSLESVIRDHNTPDSLPVLTLANADRVLRDGAYAHRVAERMLEVLSEIDRLRGVGRFYRP